MFKVSPPPLPDVEAVATVYNRVEATMLRDLLKSADIPSVIQPIYGMDPLPVFTGTSPMGEKIYVATEQAEEARAVIEAFTNGAYRPDGAPDASGEEQP